MKKVIPSNQFKKDLKRYLRFPKKLEKLNHIIRLLENEEALPRECKAHKLIGEYKGCWECHIEGDYLLIWIDDDGETICLMRLGSHSELFK